MTNELKKIETKMIFITYDYVHPDTLSYAQVLEAIESEQSVIYTTCINFFDFGLLSKGIDVKVIKENGDHILLSELLTQPNPYTLRHMRPAHHASKMLMANSFIFKKVGEPSCF